MIDATLARLSADLGARLRATGGRITTAESCTGGLVAAAITSTAGSSGWFDAGFVTYSDAMKVALLGVDAAIVAAHGAVSEATAAAMARGALQRSGATLAVAVTGIAGPGGATPGKPVGTVCFAWADGASTVVATRHFAGGRAEVRQASAVAALEGALLRIGGTSQAT